MRTRIFLPPVLRPTGGTAVLLQIARVLGEAGRDVRLVPREECGWIPDDVRRAAPVLPWGEMALGEGDLWLVPEGWVNALAPGLTSGARCVCYVQNWAYLFSALPEGVTWHQLAVEFLAVSDPVARFIRQTTGREPLVLRPGIDRERFLPPAKKPGGPVRVAYMPRKNKALARQVMDIFASRNPASEPVFLPVEGQDADGVARLLREAHIFLATGYPEGCPLPPLEALACGCLCVGFAGFGGWDYMRQAQAAPRTRPWIELREVPWEGNGFWCADADVLDAALCLEEAMALLRQDGAPLHNVLANARATADAYSEEEQRRAILAVWDALEG
jgi:hypothetical protein